MKIQIVDEPLSWAEVAEAAKAQFGEMIKATVDVARDRIALGGDLHSDEEALLLEAGSKQEDLWGINLYPGLGPEERVEFDSMINIRPTRGNRSRGVEDPQTRSRILRVIEKLIRP